MLKTTALHGRYKLGNRFDVVYSSCLEILKSETESGVTSVYER